MHARRYNTFHVQAATAADDSDRMRKVFESKAAGVSGCLFFFLMLLFLFSLTTMLFLFFFNSRGMLLG